MHNSRKNLEIKDCKEEIRKIFSGRYTLERHIKPYEIEISGTAEFKILSDQETQYFESGSYFLNGSFYNFYQTRFFCFDDNFFYILKNDKSLLHKFSLLAVSLYGAELVHDHKCVRDNYAMKLNLFEESFSMIYKVTGPQKNYMINSKFTKIL